MKHITAKKKFVVLSFDPNENSYRVEGESHGLYGLFDAAIAFKNSQPELTVYVAELKYLVSGSVSIPEKDVNNG